MTRQALGADRGESCRSSAAAATARVQYLQVDAEAAGQRIDNFLLARWKGVPRSHVYRVLRRGEVRVNRGRVRPVYRLCEGDELRLPPVRVASRDAPPRISGHPLADRVLHEDTRFLVIDKPAGLAVHGGSGLSYGAIEALRGWHPAGKDLELGHRLDRDTSGCLLLTKRRSALRHAHAAFRDGQAEKWYVALLLGHLDRRRLTVDAPLQRRERGGERFMVVDAAGKPARTLFREQQRFATTTLAQVQIMTGRTHQIRVHAAHLGVPVAGDSRYAGEAAGRVPGLRRMFLHASRLRLPDGVGGWIDVEAPLPAELAHTLDGLRRSSAAVQPEGGDDTV